MSLTVPNLKSNSQTSSSDFTVKVYYNNRLKETQGPSKLYIRISKMRSSALSYSLKSIATVDISKPPIKKITPSSISPLLVTKKKLRGPMTCFNPRRRESKRMASSTSLASKRWLVSRLRLTNHRTRNGCTRIETCSSGRSWRGGQHSQITRDEWQVCMKALRKGKRSWLSKDDQRCCCPRKSINMLITVRKRESLSLMKVKSKTCSTPVAVISKS